MGMRSTWVSSALLVTSSALGQVVSTPFQYSREVGFTYRADGLIESEQIEPSLPNQCVLSTTGYDVYGNKVTHTKANCPGATDRALFDTRNTTSEFVAVSSQPLVTDTGTFPVSLPAGQFATKVGNALSQFETNTVDPRFGIVIASTAINKQTEQFTIDDFGRKTRQLHSDGTSTITLYCLLSGSDRTSQSENCPTIAGAELFADAYSFVQTQAFDKNGSPMGPFNRVYTNRAGQKIREVTQSFDGPGQPAAPGGLIVKDTLYNSFGATIVETQPYFLDTGSSLLAGLNNFGMTMNTLDALGRVTQIDTADARGNVANVNFAGKGTRQSARITNSYSGLSITTTNSAGQTQTQVRGLDGKVIIVTDNTGAQIFHQYDAFGNLYQTIDAMKNKVNFAYDVRGRQLEINDPDSGLAQQAFNALGEPVWHQSAKMRVAGESVTTSFDRLGRARVRAEPEFTTTWTYDTCTNGIGKICSITTTGANGITKAFVYDTKARLSSARTDVKNGISYATAQTYDWTTGRPATRTYPTGLQVKYGYTPRGFLNQVILGTTAELTPLDNKPAVRIPANSALWTANSVNAWGKTEKFTYYNTVSNASIFDPATGRVSELSAGISDKKVLEYDYVWDSLGRLSSRTDSNGTGSGTNVTEDFVYDAVNRLNGYSISGASARAVSLSYNSIGNMLFKSDVGNYEYPASADSDPASKPHAVKAVKGASLNLGYTYDSSGNLFSSTGGKYKALTYTSFNLPNLQNNGVVGTRYQYFYDDSHSRLKEVHTNATGTRTTWFAHLDNAGALSFEREENSLTGGVQKQFNRHFITAGGTTVAVLVSTGALPALTENQTSPQVLTSINLVKAEFWHKDHLGSLASTTDHTGSVTERYAYDAFGKRRFTDGKYDAGGALVVDWTVDTNRGTDRGFTGHEHLDDLGLIHMNGRLFDPLIGRFLQADPVLQDTLNLQNFNRYGYCFNNPTNCTDATGYCFLGCFWQPKNWPSWLKIVAVLVIGSLSAGAGSFFGKLFVGAGLTSGAATIAAAAVGGFISGAIVSGTLKGALQGAFTAGAFAGTGNLIDLYELGEVASVALHGVTGCMTSVVSGNKCGPGALSAAFSESILPFKQGLQSPLLAIAVSAIAGGTASVLGGGKFKNGARTAAMAYIYNCLAGHSSGACGPKSEPMVASAAVVGGVIVLGGLMVVGTLSQMWNSLVDGLRQVGAWLSSTTEPTGGMEFLHYTTKQGFDEWLKCQCVMGLSVGGLRGMVFVSVLALSPTQAAQELGGVMPGAGDYVIEFTTEGPPIGLMPTDKPHLFGVTNVKIPYVKFTYAGPNGIPDPK